MNLRFIHPPRTGGTSIKMSWKLVEPEYRGHALPEPDDGFRYGFTRNPWDRAISLWCLQRPRVYSPEAFQGWMMSGMRGGARLGVDHKAPTTLWLDGCQFIGRFEHREDDLQMLARMLDREPPELHVNESKRNDYRWYHNDETAELIALLYKDDIDRFGYTF